MKHLSNDALFVTETPALELSLSRNVFARAPGGQHFGLAVDSVSEVETQLERLGAAGYKTDVEREKMCCHAVQTKVWVRDPDGRRWETYFVHAESEGIDDRKDASSAGKAACCA